MEVGFSRRFMSAVSLEDAFPTGEGNSALLTLLNLEVWGLPTSKPERDPSNGNFVYQRFQRGIMHFDATTGATEALLLGDYFKSVLTGEALPPDLAEQASGSSFLRQYDPASPRSLARPEELESTDLSRAFEREATDSL